jgi:hypothetical protein
MLEYCYIQNWRSKIRSDYEGLENKQRYLKQIFSEGYNYQKFMSKE